jgi:D-cysteine desulfhydrase
MSGVWSGAPRGRDIGRLCLAHLPTPIVRPARLAEAMGIDLWMKRDDATGGAESGNKVRKLEFLLADAQRRDADTVITCGGIQSNHARATALVAAGLGMRALLFLRTTEPDLDASRAPLEGNVLLDRMVGAELRLITPAQYRERGRIMAEAAVELEAAGRRPYVIPEGGSNGLGALGYVEAMAEVRRQLDVGIAGGQPFDVVVHACGSGGTAAGVALGAGRYEVAAEVRAMAVCDDAPTFETVIDRIMAEAIDLDPRLGRAAARLVVDDRAKGPAYGVSTADQRRRVVQAARLSGLVFDPVYTGKALSGLWDLVESGALRGERVLFLHTGGLPGLLAQGATFADSV